jgi:hypothetical protein
MKKKIFRFLGLSIVIALFLFNPVVNATNSPVTLYYGDFPLSGFMKMPGNWDLNEGDLIISYTLDLTGAPNIANTGNWGQMGIVGIFSPDGSGARMVGFLCDGGNAGDLFPIYPDVDNNLDLDDKFNFQRFPNTGSWDEQMYDILCDGSPIGTFNPWANYGIWFDRDGVDPYQPNMWGMVYGGTYNTGGIYDIELTYKKHSSTLGYVCARFFPMLLNPLNQSDPDDDIDGIPTGFYESGWTPDGPEKFPAGISFEADEASMSGFYVYVDGYPYPGEIIVKDLKVTGYLATIVIDGCDTGVRDRLVDDETLISLEIFKCAKNVKNHGEFLRCVDSLTNELQKAGIITGKEKGAIQSCAARANIPNY